LGAELRQNFFMTGIRYGLDAFNVFAWLNVRYHELFFFLLFKNRVVR